MLKKNSKKLLVSLMLPIVVSLSFISQSIAQDPPNLIAINQTQLKPGMVPRFQELHREVIMPNQRENGLAWRITQQTIFGDSFEVVVSLPITNFAQLDSFQALESELADDFVESAVEWQRLFVIEALPELGIGGGGQGVQPFRRLARIQVKQGKIAEFEQFWTDTIRPAMTASGIIGYSLFRTVLGGPQGEYYGTLDLPNFAALDGLNVTGGISAQAQADLQEEFGELVEEFEVTFVTVNQNLSYGLQNLQP